MSKKDQQQRARPGQSFIWLRSHAALLWRSRSQTHAQRGNESAIRGVSLTSHQRLFITLAIFLFLSTFHSIIVPISQGEDELAHFRYISFIAQNGRLPVNELERKQAWYRSDWPPLYHLVVGWLISPLDTTQPHLKDVGESPRRRLVGEIFYPRLIIYTEDANWPWQGGILGWHLGRFVSILFAGLAVVFTYLTMLDLGTARGNGDAKLIASVHPSSARYVPALAAAALLAFMPRYLFSSAMLADDSLFILLSAIFIWLLLRASRGDDRWTLYAGLGLLLGLSITTKYSTGLLPLAIVPVVWWRAREAGWSLLQAWGRLGLAWLFTMLGASWWFGWIFYHFNTVEEDGLIVGLLSPLLASGPDVSMRRVFSWLEGAEFSGLIRPGAVAEGSFSGWWIYLFQTFWGVPVLERDPVFPWAYLLMFLFCLLAGFGLWRSWQAAGSQRRLELAVLIIILGLLLPFPILRYFLTFNILETGQGRHILYPAGQATPILLILGWLWFGKRMIPQRNSLRFTFYTFLPSFLLLFWSIFQLFYMAKVYPEPLPVQTTTFNPARIAQPISQTFGNEIQLLGYDSQLDPEQALLRLTLFWKSLKAADENYRVRVSLVNPAGQVRLTWLGHPLNGRYPTRAWDSGDVVRDRISLPLASLPPARYEVQLDLWHETEAVSLNEVPVQLDSFDMEKSYPLAGSSTLTGIDFRLWLEGEPVRHRQTLALSWAESGGTAQAGSPPAWVLRGPDDLPRYPASLDETLAIFMVGADWPSGDYRLGLAASTVQTGPLFTVANEARLFSLPAELADQPGWRPVEANFAGKIKLSGYIMPDRRLLAGDNLTLRLAWQSLAPVLPDTLTFAVLLDGRQQPYGQVDRYPAGFYSPMLWAEGEVVPDTLMLPVRPDTPPGIYFLHVGQYQLVKGQPVSLPLVHQGQPTNSTAIVIGPFKVGGPPPEVTVSRPAPQVSLNQPVGDQIRLLGYDLSLSKDHVSSNGEAPISPSQASILPASALKLTLYWQAEAAIQSDYTTFLHLRDSANQTVAQKDQPPAAGAYPTSLWDQGEVIVDEIILPLDQVAPGEYQPVVGLYEYGSGARLSVPGSPASEVTLQPVRVE